MRSLKVSWGPSHFENCCCRQDLWWMKNTPLRKVYICKSPGRCSRGISMPFASPLTVGGKRRCDLGLFSTGRDCCIPPDHDLRALPFGFQGGKGRWTAQLILDLCHLKPLSRWFCCILPVKNHWHGLALCPAEMRNGPKAQGDMVTLNTGGTRHNFRESQYFLSLA